MFYRNIRTENTGDAPSKPKTKVGVGSWDATNVQHTKKWYAYNHSKVGKAQFLLCALGDYHAFPSHLQKILLKYITKYTVYRNTTGAL